MEYKWIIKYNIKIYKFNIFEVTLLYVNINHLKKLINLLYKNNNI